MGVKLIPLKKEHLLGLLNEDQNAHLKNVIPPAQIEFLTTTGFNYSMINDAGKILMCGGVALYWKDRGEAWAVRTKDCGKDFVGIVRLSKKIMWDTPIKRIEACIETTFPEGHRWIKLLGFKLEAPLLKSYYQNGADVSLYARIK